jgi:hypothetical protein
MRFLILFFLSVNALASTQLDNFFRGKVANDLCQQAKVNNGNISRTYLKMIKSDEADVYFVFYKKGVSTLTGIDIITEKKTEIEVEGQIVDVVFTKSEVYFLAETEVYVIDRATNRLKDRFSTLPRSYQYKKYAMARGLYIANDEIYIAHGTYGVSVIDKITGAHIKFINPAVPQPMSAHISTLSDIEGKDGVLYFVYDDVTLARKSKAFEGLMLYDLKNLKPIKTIRVNQKVEGYFQPNLTMLEDDLIISNLNLNYRHQLSKLNRDKLMKPQQRIWKYETGVLIEKGLIKENKVYGCFEETQYNGTLSAGFHQYR